MAITSFPSAQWSEPQNSGAGVRIRRPYLLHVGEGFYRFDTRPNLTPRFEDGAEPFARITTSAVNPKRLAQVGQFTRIYG